MIGLAFLAGVVLGAAVTRGRVRTRTVFVFVRAARRHGVSDGVVPSRAQFGTMEASVQ